MPRKSNLIESPHNAILGLAQKFILSRVLMMFAEIGLGDLLKESPLHLNEIAKSLNVNSDALRRFLRLLTAHKIITDLGNDMYGPTVISQYFNQLLKTNLVSDYIGLDKALDALKNNDKNWSSTFGEAFNQYLTQYFANTTEQHEDDIMSFAHEFIIARVAIGAAELKIGELVKDKAITLDVISAHLNIDPTHTRTFLRALVAHNILEEREPDVYGATPLSDSFDRLLSPHIIDGYKLFNGAYNTLKTNSGSWEHVFGKSFYAFLNEDEHKLQMFKEWCVQSAIDWLPPILRLCDLPEQKCLVDVGGGGGHFLASVLQQNPHMKGVLFDQPSIITGAEKSPILDGVKDRASFKGGDFFKDIPEGGDIYTICRTLLNWDDEKSIEIINNCHKAMKGNGKLWIIDFLVPDSDHPKYPRAVINDISLFVIFNSAIRTEKEWRKLIANSLFTVSNIYIAKDEMKPEPYYPMCIIEAVPKSQSLWKNSSGVGDSKAGNTISTDTMPANNQLKN